MHSTLLVLGDSVPLGERTDAEAWPHRLPELVDSFDGRVDVRGSMGVSLASLADGLSDHLADAATDSLTVLVHAGHNDAQLSGDDPRVTKETFRDAATEIDRTLASRPAVDRHAFVGLVPLLRVDRPGAVPFDEAQPDRSLAYDDILAETVADHVPVAHPVDDWVDRTEDGVHPNEAGHAFVAERVAEWLD